MLIFFDLNISSEIAAREKYQYYFMECLCRFVKIDMNCVLRLRSSSISLNECLTFFIKNLGNKNKSISVLASKFIEQMTHEIWNSDQQILVQNNSKYEDDDVVLSDWHKLEMFKNILEEYQNIIKIQIDFSR